MRIGTGLSGWRAVFALAVLAVLLHPSNGRAADFRAGGRVVIPAGDTLRDDLYVCGGKVDIDGVVLGDVVACGGNISVNGSVSGSLLSGAGSTSISGSVGRTVRCGSGEIGISGTVGEDAVVGGGRFMLARGAHVGRDLLAGGGELEIDGDVERNVHAGGGSLALAGRVGGDVRARAERTRLMDGARVAGDFLYTSERSVVRSPGAMVGGKIEMRVPSGHPKPSFVGRMFLFVYKWERSFAGLLAVGLLLVLPFPTFARRVLDALGSSPGPSLLVGVVLFLAVPFVAVTVGFLGLLMGGWWIGMSALVLFGLSLALGIAVTGAFLGQRILQRQGHEVRLWWALLAGLAILTLMLRVPFVGLGVAGIAAVFGLGALAIAARRSSAAAAAA